MSNPQPLTTLPGPVLDLLTEASELIDRFLAAESEDWPEAVELSARLAAAGNSDPADDLQREDAPTRAHRDPNHHTLRQAIEWAEQYLDEEDISGARACARFREWLGDNDDGESAPAPGIHQAAMEERLQTVLEHMQQLLECKPTSNLAGNFYQKQVAETLANDARWLKLLADELMAKEVCSDAGQVYDDLAEDCMRAVVAWQGS